MAALAGPEIVDLLMRNSNLIFVNGYSPVGLSVYSSREGKTDWPFADGVIVIEENGVEYKFALEFKTKNEGIHGILTALGQAHAYINKGYSGTIIVVPTEYATLSNPGHYLNSVIINSNPTAPIIILNYEEPNKSIASPFKGKINCQRSIDKLTLPTTTASSGTIKVGETQWAHVREGDTEPDIFYKYLSEAKQLSLRTIVEPEPLLPTELIEAVDRITDGKKNPLKYLSYSPNDDFHSRVWRHFFYKNMFVKDNMEIWNKVGSTYEIKNGTSQLMYEEGKYKKYFTRKKKKIIEDLNKGVFSENGAWELFAINVHERAHSYRENIDSGLEHIGLIDNDGKPSDLGYKFVDLCERTGRVDYGKSKMLLGSTIIKNGQLGALLHYIFKLSEEKFKSDPLAFTTPKRGAGYSFNISDYKIWLEDQMIALKVMNKGKPRGGVKRKPFQGELAVLCKLGVIQSKPKDRWRLGVGLVINWPVVSEYMNYEF